MEVREINLDGLEVGQTVLVTVMDCIVRRSYYGVITYINGDHSEFTLDSDKRFRSEDVVSIVLILRRLPREEGTIVGFRNNIGEFREAFIYQGCSKWLQFYGHSRGSRIVKSEDGVESMEFVDSRELYHRGDWEIVDKWV